MGRTKNKDAPELLSLDKDPQNQFEVTLDDLTRLIECRGSHSVKYLKERYGGIQGLCSKLKTCTHEGTVESLIFNSFLVLLAIISKTLFVPFLEAENLFIYNGFILNNFMPLRNSCLIEKLKSGNVQRKS